MARRWVLTLCGGMGTGTGENFWHTGDEGVRVTVIRVNNGLPVTTPIDITNNSPNDITVNFGKVCKVAYRNGHALTPNTQQYAYINPSQPLPQIITSGSGNASIEAIKSYFTDEQVIRSISSLTGINFDTLINGGYKILIEPIAYFTFDGVRMAMTAHEASLYDQALSGGLRSKMVSLSHKNLPLAMFLETPDLNFPAWSGSTTTPVSNSDIQAALGLGIIRFSEADPPPVPNNQYTYRCDTEVITSVTVSSSTKRTPENPVYVTFTIDGRAYTHSNIYIPAGDSQLAWVKWKTPRQPCTITITVSSNSNVSDHTIVVSVVDMNENEPPDPQANDRNDSFQIPGTPVKSNVTSLTWGEWDCWWHANWVWVPDWDWCDHGDWGHWVDNGDWEDQGWYEYEWLPYSASLAASMKIQPDEKAPTATSTKMKSGYGFNMDVSAELRSTAPGSHITGAQNVVAYFPEFYYQSYWWLLERRITGYSSAFEFKNNKYSTYNRRVHFAPIWYPDSQYVAYGKVLDAWTPAGMLQINLTSGITIEGNLFSDWHIGPKQ